jgi:hypothetical protein
MMDRFIKMSLPSFGKFIVGLTFFSRGKKVTIWFFYYLNVGVEKDIPRCQRRGAIIVLGMLAVARRDVVTDRIELLLKVGLGPFGKVRFSLTALVGALLSRDDVQADLTLARYTCVALQRVSGSVKKVKGAFSHSLK